MMLAELFNIIVGIIILWLLYKFIQRYFML